MADVIPVKFIVEEPGKEMVDLRLEQDVIKIGRGARKGIDIQLEDAGVARVHATIQIKAENDVSIVDMGGGGGTYIDGKKIPSKGKLQNASIITVGKTQIRFYIGADALVEGIPAPKAVKIEPEASTEFDLGATLPAEANAAPTGSWQGAEASPATSPLGGFGQESPPTPVTPAAAFGSAPAPTYAAPPPLAASFGQAAPSAPSAPFGYPQASPVPSLPSVAPPSLAAAPQAPKPASPSSGFPATAGPSPARPSPSATSLPAANFGPTSPSGSQSRFPPQASPFGAAGYGMPAPSSFGGPQAPALSPAHTEGTTTFGPLGPPPPALVSRLSGPSLPILLEVADRLNKEIWFVQEAP